MYLTKLVKTSCVAVLCIILSIKSFAQPTANFIANPTSGCAPLLVNFVDQSTGNPTTWKWVLGNGTISQLQNPSVVYFNPGQYTVTLIATNASGVDSVVRTQYINVYAKPTIDFSASTYSGCAPMPVTFTDLSTPGSGTNVSWQWDFGDGNFSTLQNPTHTYTANGSFNVSLLVNNSHGCLETITRTQLINITDKPTANFTNSSSANCGAPLVINFTNQSTGAGTLTYLWSFGDASASTDQNPSHTYLTTGTFSIQLVVYNQNGCTDTIRRPNAFTIANNITMFSVPATACANTAVSITNGTAPAAINSFWDFGDSTTSTASVPVKTYTTAGTYQIKLINNYGICVDSMIHTITILEQPTASFTASPLSSCYAPLIVHFTNTSANAVSYLWNFGDGGSSTQASPSHTYTNQGNYTVTLTTTSANGCTKTTTLSQYINIQLPVVAVNQLPQRGCAPFTWTFVHTVFGGDTIVSYHWDFGDSTSSNLQSPTHIFGVGVYDIVLTIVTSSGCTDTVRYINGIKAGVRPIAAFVATPRDVCALLPVIFTDSTSPVGAATQWNWDFGDGGTSTTQNPQHTYTDTGYFPVQLIASNNGCPDTLLVPDYIHITPPIALFTIGANCNNRLRRTFTDHSIGADTWAWTFGDGATSTDQNPVHDYTASGAFVVTLTVHNNTTGCDFTKTMNITVVNQLATINATDTVICRPNSITFNAAGITPTLFSSFRWNFGDVTTGLGSPITKMYYNPGIYSITLVTSDRNGCRDTIFKPLYITVNGPTSNFRSSVTSICSASIVSFSDSSTTDGRNPLAQWIWNYGDGIIDTLNAGSTNHTYTTGGSYTVALTVLDSSGCRNQFSRQNLITVFHPSASFGTYDTISCPNHSVTFNNTSTGAGLTYLWNFGDGTTSTDVNPAHNYNITGIYNIKLTVFDQNGCKDSIVRTSLVNIVNPSSRYTVSDTLGTCPPLIVNFTNQSLNYTSLLWEFGDGTTATTPNPSHFYSVSGNFISKLTITGPGGCISTKTKTIVVHGPRGTFTYAGLSGCAPMAVNFRATTRGTNSYVWDFSDGWTNLTSDSVQIHIYTSAGSFLPKVILKDTAGCLVPVMGRDSIRVYDMTTAFDFNAQPHCDQGTVQFNNTTTAHDIISSYSWSFGDGGTSDSQSPAHLYSTTGTYFPQLITSSQHGCRDTVRSLNPVKIVASPQGVITQTANGCVSLTVRFNASLAIPDTSSLTWNWDLGNNNSSQLIAPPTQTYSVAGTYPINLLVTNSTGCKDTVRSTVEAYAIPTIDAGIDTIVCKGRGMTLNATGAATYVWTPSTGLSCTNCASPLANPASPIQYFVTGTSVHGCVNRDSISLRVKYPFIMTSSSRDSLCMGSSLRMTASGASTYQWTPATGLDNPSSASPMATPSSTTTYQVIGTDDRNCFKDTAYIPIIVFNIPTVEAGIDKTINVGQTITLMPQVSADVISARWSPTGSIFRDIFPGITVKPRETTIYTVLVSNRGGCTASDQLTVNVLCNGANMFIPNSFSPNNDGMNDLFYPRGSGIFTIKKIKVFSRWGEVVFEKDNFTANDASKGWNGTFKGRQLNPDVFVYMVEVVCDNNEALTFKGNVALLK